MELDRCRDLGPYGRSRSPEPTYGVRNSHEVADLKDKLEATQSELRRAQAELRLNQSDYDRSHVELEQMQEKVNLYYCVKPTYINLKLENITLKKDSMKLAKGNNTLFCNIFDIGPVIGLLSKNFGPGLGRVNFL